MTKRRNQTMSARFSLMNVARTLHKTLPVETLAIIIDCLLGCEEDERLTSDECDVVAHLFEALTKLSPEAVTLAKDGIANLHAAAPELLDGCKAALISSSNSPNHPEYILPISSRAAELCLAAIAKAEGKAP